MNAVMPPRPQPLLAALLGMLVAAVGVLVLWGWAHDIGVIKSVLAGHATMKPNTALALVLCGVAVSLSVADRKTLWRLVAVLLAVGVMLVGALSLRRELLGRDFGIDEMLFREIDAARPGMTRPGRMAPAAAFCLLLRGLAVALTALPSRLRLQCTLAAALGTTAMAVAVVALIDWFADDTLAFLLSGAKTMPCTRRWASLHWAWPCC
jgi:hypothetical protein